jgi:tetratricopeptide (TPR) repeat protein
MPENTTEPPLGNGDNTPASRDAVTHSAPGISTVRSRTPAQRRKRVFLYLEILTILVALIVIGLYGNFLGTLGVLSFHARRYDLAEFFFRDALWVQEKAHGSQGLAINEPLNDLAYLYYETDRMDKAVSTAERSLSICRTNLAPGEPRYAWTLSMVSLAYDGSGNFVEAERMANEALPILETTEGKQSWPVATTLNRLGMALDGEGRFREAETALRRALAIREAFGGSNWNGLVPVLQNLASVYSEEGKENEATICRQRVESIEGHRH